VCLCIVLRVFAAPLTPAAPVDFEAVQLSECQALQNQYEYSQSTSTALRSRGLNAVAAAARTSSSINTVGVSVHRALQVLERLIQRPQLAPGQVYDDVPHETDYYVTTLTVLPGVIETWRIDIGHILFGHYWYSGEYNPLYPGFPLPPGANYDQYPRRASAQVQDTLNNGLPKDMFPRFDFALFPQFTSVPALCGWLEGVIVKFHTQSVSCGPGIPGFKDCYFFQQDINTNFRKVFYGAHIQLGQGTAADPHLLRTAFPLSKETNGVASCPISRL
jgi:hypothetical protein